MLGAIIGGIGAIAGGLIGSSGAKKAAKKQAAAQQAAIDEQRRQYDTTREDYAPYRHTGNAALNQLNALYGISPYTAPPPAQAQQPSNPLAGVTWPGLFSGLNDKISREGLPIGTNVPSPGQQQPTAGESPAGQGGAPNYASFFSSPDYQFNLSEGLKAVENSAAARGGLYSGNALRALQERGAGIASQQYGNHFNRLAALAGIGQTATNAGAAYGSQMAGNVGNLLAAQGDARASGVAGSANAWGNALGSLASIGQNWWNTRGIGPPIQGAGTRLGG